MEALVNKYVLSGKLEIFQAVPKILLLDEAYCFVVFGFFLPCVEIREELFACGQFQNTATC